MAVIEKITLCDDDIDLLKEKGILYADGEILLGQIEIKFEGDEE